MDQIRTAGEAMETGVDGVAQETTNDIRPLTELEVALAGGGDGAVCW